MPAIKAVRLCEAGDVAVVLAAAIVALIPLRCVVSAAERERVAFAVQTTAHTRARQGRPQRARPLSAEMRSVAGLRWEPARSRQPAVHPPSAAEPRLATLRYRRA